MKYKTNGGFTIIEVMLFLAISGLVILIGLAGVSGRTRSVQYRDSIAGLESAIAEAFSEVSSGVRNASAARGCVNSNVTNAAGNNAGTTGCINMGVVIKFETAGDNTEVKVYDVVGRHIWGSSLDGKSDEELIQDSKPTVNSRDISTLNIDWGTLFSTGKYSQGATSGNTDGFGVLRSPGSANIYPIIIRDDKSYTATGIYSAPAASDPIFGSDGVAKYCFDGVSGLSASMIFGGSDSSSFSFNKDDRTC